MTSEELDIAFNNAVKSINEHTEPFPADILLRLYAYYKRATNDADIRAAANHIFRRLRPMPFSKHADLPRTKQNNSILRQLTNIFVPKIIRPAAPC